MLGFETGYFVFEVLNLQRKFALDLVDLVYFGVDFLKFVQRDDLFLGGKIVRFAALSA